MMPRLSIARIAGTALLVSAPILLGLAALAIWSGLHPALALTAGVVIWAALFAALATHATDMAKVDAYIAAISGLDPLSAEASLPRAPEMTGERARRLALSLTQLFRTWRRRDRARQRALDNANAILNALKDPLILIDADRTVARVNGAARGLFGDHMAGRDLSAVVRHPEVLSAVDRVIAGGRAEAVEFTQRVPVERVFEVSVQTFGDTSRRTGRHGEREEAGVDGGGEGPVALLAFHDITAMKRNDQLRSDFVANASHELRTPLSALMGFLETVRGPARDDPEARERFLAIMTDQANRMNRLVADLMSLSRIEQDEHTPPTAAINLSAIVERTATALELTAQRRRTPIEIDLPADLPLVTGDEDQLAQVFQNLVDNAVKYGGEGKPVRIEGGVDRSGRRPMVAIAVIDRGPGIPREHIPRLTERFFRVDTARSRTLGGTGLGLAIVKHIISRHRGRLIIDSEIGRGSRFTVLLPLAEGARAAAE